MRRAIVGALTTTLIVAAVVVPASPAYAAIAAQPVGGQLAFPAGFTFAPDGRIFYAERFSGEIRILDPVTLSDTLFFDVPNIDFQGEHGLLGVAIHPDYPTTPLVYAFAVRNVGGAIRTQIVSITDTGGAGSNMQVIFDEPTTGTIHVGGRIMFGPDGNLFGIIGENGNPSHAQNLNNNRGKLIRMMPDGSIPPNNPIAGTYIAAYGFRNSFGFTFDPLTGFLWEDDNGPECNDEVNRVRPGRNYGWGPNATCLPIPQPPRNTNQDGPNPQQPLLFYTNTIAPTGMAFCTACGLGTGSEGALYMGAFNTGDLRRIVLTANRRGVRSQNIAYSHPNGILAVEAAPDGSLYISDDQRIYKLVQT